jgi:hypothetical protein
MVCSIGEMKHLSREYYVWHHNKYTSKPVCCGNKACRHKWNETNMYGSSTYSPHKHRPLTGPLHTLARPKSQEPCPSEEVPDCPQTQASNVLRVQEEGSHINMPGECHQGFTLTQHMGNSFLPSPTFPTQGTMCESHEVKMSSQGVMTSEKANNYPGLCPVKGH